MISTAETDSIAGSILVAKVSAAMTPLVELPWRTVLKECVRAPSAGLATEESPEATLSGDSPVLAVSAAVAVSMAEAAAFTVAVDIDSLHEVNES
jgi:hypothetical protein